MRTRRRVIRHRTYKVLLTTVFGFAVSLFFNNVAVANWQQLVTP